MCKLHPCAHNSYRGPFGETNKYFHPGPRPQRSSRSHEFAGVLRAGSVCSQAAQHVGALPGVQTKPAASAVAAQVARRDADYGTQTPLRLLLPNRSDSGPPMPGKSRRESKLQKRHCVGTAYIPFRALQGESQGQGFR